MPRLPDLAALMRQARELQKDEFVANWPGLFLVCAPDEKQPVKFITQPAESMLSYVHTPTRSHFEVQRVAKTVGQPPGDPISVGRSRSCDIVLKHPSISKLHAHFRRDGEGVALLDNTSRNGTAVNGEPLIPEWRTVVRPGDRIRFGTLESILLDASGLYDFLH